MDRFTPLLLKQHILRNRVVVPPMASTTATTEGFATPKTLEHYARLAQSGVGLVIVEYTFVHPSGRSEPNQLGISSEAHIPGLAQIAEIIHQSGALAGIQFSHGGGKSSFDLTGGRLMGPSGIPVPVKGETLETPAPMSTDDMDDWREAFAYAVTRAVRAGFDLVEFHSAHGYGLNQWLSPLTNQRMDNYGVGLSGRSRLLLEIVQAARGYHPDLLISVRMPGQDFLPGGLTTTDMIAVARSLELTGVDLLHVSSGIGGWRRPSDRVGEGYLVHEASLIQSAVAIPVIGVGGIETADYIDRGLAAGRFSLAAVGRAILKDPMGWRESCL